MPYIKSKLILNMLIVLGYYVPAFLLVISNINKGGGDITLMAWFVLCAALHFFVLLYNLFTAKGGFIQSLTGFMLGVIICMIAFNIANKIITGDSYI